MNSRFILLLTAVLLITAGNFAFARPEPTDSAVAYDFAPDEEDSVIQARINNIEAEMEIGFNSTIRSFIDYFTIRHRDYIRKMLTRQKAYFPIFEKYLAENDMPDDLKYLTIVESGIDPTAKSRAGALGMWQFMPSTGKIFKLDYDYYIDERMDPYKSTEAACKYLKQLYGMFNDWELALAAYNCGPGNVRRAIRKSGYKEGFWEIYNYLPKETRSYVPQFMAINYVMRYADDHNLYVDYPMQLPEFDTLIVNQYFNVKEFATKSGICLSEIQQLNPEIKRNVIPAHKKDYVLRVPKDRIAYIQENKVALLEAAKKQGNEALVYKPNYPSSQSTVGKDRYAYKVRSGDVLGLIAQRHGVRVSDLRAWNNINGNMIYAGQTLYIYTKPSAAPKPTTTAVATKNPTPTSKVYPGKTYTVQPGDTLWGISKKFEGLTVDKIKSLNNLNNNSLKPGQTLKLG